MAERAMSGGRIENSAPYLTFHTPGYFMFRIPMDKVSTHFLSFNFQFNLPSLTISPGFALGDIPRNYLENVENAIS